MKIFSKKLLNSIVLIFMPHLLFASISINLSYIAQSGLPMPTYNETYNVFQPPHLNLGHLVFGAKGSAGNIALFSNLYGRLAPIASNNTAVPGGSGNFTGFTNMVDFSTPSDHIASILNNSFAFLGTDSNFNTGIYRADGINQMTLIVNTNTPAPGSIGNFSSVSNPTLLADNSVGFAGITSDNHEGIFYSNSKGLLSKLVDDTTSIPNGHGNFQHFHQIKFSTTPNNIPSLVFIGTGSLKQTGLYLMQNNKLTMIVNQDSTMPGDHIGYFINFTGVSYDATNNQIAFIGQGILGQDSVFLYNSQTITPILSLDTLIPDGIGQFKSFSNLNLQNNNLIFTATGQNGQEGVYLTQIGGNTYKILSNQDSIQGKKISNIEISNQAYSSNQLAMLIQFQDGSSGIYLATLAGNYN